MAKCWVVELKAELRKLEVKRLLLAARELFDFHHQDGYVLFAKPIEKLAIRRQANVRSTLALPEAIEAFYTYGQIAFGHFGFYALGNVFAASCST